MDADQHGKDRSNGSKVTSVGNSWIICRSKLNIPGRIYYFNTVTGEAAWNLSDVEKEKAKRRTRNHQNEIESYPEPKEPPMDQSNNINQNRNTDRMGNKATPSKIYNKQVINNRFTKPAYPFSPFTTPCNHNMVQACGCLNPGAPMGLTLPTPTCNPNLWAVPASHQIFIAPTPLVNHPQAAPMFNNPQDNGAVHNSTAPSRRFQMHKKPTEYNNSSPRKHFVKTNKYDRFGHRNEGSFPRKFDKNFSSSSNDLRHLISSKRTLRNSEQSRNEDNFSEIEGTEDINDSFMDGVEEEHQESTTKTRRKDDCNEENYQSDVDNDWLEENISFKGTKVHLNVTNLKKLAKPNAIADCWYIAVDKTILTSHLNFLNILISSDEQCHLMVPQQVLQELRVMADTSCNMPRLRRRARRAVDFLSQQVKAGGAIIGTDATDADNVNYMMHSCFNLVQRNYHVVLLSNRNELEHYKTSSQIPIFNVNELKMFLSNDSEDKEPSPEPSSQPSELPITITIPNDLVPISQKSLLSNNEQTHSSIDISMKENFSKPQCVKDKEINDQQNEIVNQLPSTSNKQTVDAEVQTETIPVPKVANQLVASKNLSDGPQTDDVNKILPSSNRLMTLNRSVEPNNAMQANRSKTQIRLKRSTPQVSVGVYNDFEQKRFKWRKRRYTTSMQTNKFRLPSSSNSDSGQPSHSDLTSPQEHLKIIPFGQLEKSNSKVHIGTQAARQVSFDSISQGSNVDDNILDSETSSCVYVRRNIGEITIEETSTSGVISNTSRGNSDCGSIPKVQLITNKSSARKDKPVVEPHMFEVTNQAMEHYLNMRCDEWVSQFNQIMEDVLAQVLHQRPSFLKDKFPPPWTIHEAAQCIKMNFREDINIVDAATKLSQHLFEISDKRGRLNMPVRPSDFMKMYSYGVYLIDTLQSAIDSCEDLHAAAENLSLLLSDIQNPNADYSHNETFGDNPLDVSASTSVATSRFDSNVHNDDSNLGSKTFDSYAQNNASNFNNKTFESYVQTNDTNLGNETYESYIQNNDSNLGSNPFESNAQNKDSNLGSKTVESNVQNKDSNLGSKTFESNVQSKDSNLGSNTFESNAQNKDSNLDNKTVESNVQNKDSNLGSKTFESNMQSKDSNLDSKTFESNVQENDSNLGSKRKRLLDSELSDIAKEKKYNLRSKRILEEKGDQQVKFVRKIDIESTFFTSLDLQKNPGENVITKSNNAKSHILRPNNANIEHINKGSIEPIFVRKFTVCPQFESQLRNKKTGQSTDMDRQPLDMDQLDYSANYDDWYEHYHCSEGDSNSKENEPVIKETNEHKRIGESLDPAVKTDDNKNKVIVILKCFVKNLIETFTRVRRFCEQIKNEYTLSEPTLTRKREIHKKAETAHLIICDLSKSLKSLFYRESSKSENTLQTLLEKAAFHNLDLSEKQFAGYRDIIAICIDNATTLLEAVNLIITAAKT